MGMSASPSTPYGVSVKNWSRPPLKPTLVMLDHVWSHIGSVVSNHRLPLYHFSAGSS